MSPGRQSLDFCDNWRFEKGEHVAAEVVDFDDQSWAAVRVPHDWAISGPFDPPKMATLANCLGAALGGTASHSRSMANRATECISISMA